MEEQPFMSIGDDQIAIQKKMTVLRKGSLEQNNHYENSTQNVPAPAAPVT